MESSAVKRRCQQQQRLMRGDYLQPVDGPT